MRPAHFLLLLTALACWADDAGTLTTSGKGNSAMAFEHKRLPLREGWLIQNASLVPEAGDIISTETFAPEGWHATSVPATALTALTRNGVYPDMRFGLNALRIPDASDEFNEAHDLAQYSHLPDKRNPWRDGYWYRTTFDLPETSQGKRVWLDFDAINYRAEVWLNGVRVAGPDEVVGSFSRYRFDVTAHAKWRYPRHLRGVTHADLRSKRPAKTNCLAVKVLPVDHPGVPDAQLDVFGKVRNFRKEIMKDVTLVMSIGYDCMPTVPDRLMGIWQGVAIDLTGPVVIRHPFVRTHLPLPETSPASLTVSVEVRNTTNALQKGTLRGVIVEDGAAFSKEIQLGPWEREEIVFDPDECPQLVMANPRLWWPNGYGEQNLYTLALSVEVDGRPSDQQRATFGIRHVTKTLHELDGAHGLRLHINGEKIFCRGGYIQPEIMYDWDADRMEIEVRYLAGANLNLVYFEDVPNPPDAFLDACDRYGVMFGNCFYGCYWMQPGTDHPQDLDLLSRGTVDIIKRYRNHPSLVLYMAMNEGETREAVYTMWREHVTALDGTRLFIPSGSFPDYREDVPAWIKPDTPVGMNDYRPKSYGWQAPATYYQWVREERNWMFMIESGSASLPPVDSLRRFIPDLGRTAVGAPYPLSETWAHHGANSYYKPYDEAIRRLYGEPDTVVDYCMKGHLVTADQHRAMFEAAQHRMWDITSGFTQWKVNACWPSVQWQIYDWFLKPMVSYYFIKNACEPLHVQMDPIDNTVTVVNHGIEPRERLVVKARVLDADMHSRWEKEETVSVGANTYRDVFSIPRVADISGVYFVKLELRDAGEEPVSSNFYWLLSDGTEDFTALAKLPPVEVNVRHETEYRGGEVAWVTPRECVVRATVENPTDALAFFVHVAVTKGQYGDEVLPVFWDDNYFSLLPGESRRASATLRVEDLEGATPFVEVGGWNVQSAYECTGLELSQQDVGTNEPFKVAATIAWTFLDGSMIDLCVDGRVVESKRVYARPRAPQHVDFSVALSEPGLHEVAVGGQTASIRISVLASPTRVKQEETEQ